MGNLAEILADRFTGHNVNLLRLEAGERQKIGAMLVKLHGELGREVQQKIPAGGLTEFQRNKLQALFSATDRIIVRNYTDIARQHRGGLLELAAFEGQQAQRLTNKAIGVSLLNVGVPVETLRALVNDDIVVGMPAREWWERQGGSLRARFQDTIRRGVFAGETTDQLVQRVRGTRAGNYQDGLMAISRREAEALVRTSVQSVANMARYEGLKANADVVKGVQVLTALDGRVCPICMARSGFAWDWEGKPLNDQTKEAFPGPPPWHFGDRCSLIPVVKSWGDLIREAKGNKALARKLDRAEAKFPIGTQASMDGQVAEDLSYEQWLKTKPDEFQKEVLGLGRWNLWRRGKISLVDLIDQLGRPLTLDELKSMAGVETADLVASKLPASEEPEVDASQQEAATANPFPAQRELAAKPVVKLKRMDESGVNTSRRAEFTDGGLGVFKPLEGERAALRAGIEQYYLREAVASDVAHIVGYNDLVPTTAVTKVRGQLGSMQAFVKATRADRLDDHEMFGTSVKDRQRTLLFDAIIGNTDRHEGNWMVTKNGKLVLIDHGLSFSITRTPLRLGFLGSMSRGDLRRAIPDHLKTPWREKWAEVKAALETRGIEPEAIALAERRLQKIMAPGTTWEQLATL